MEKQKKRLELVAGLWLLAVGFWKVFYKMYKVDNLIKLPFQIFYNPVSLILK